MQQEALHLEAYYEHYHSSLAVRQMQVSLLHRPQQPKRQCRCGIVDEAPLVVAKRCKGWVDEEGSAGAKK